MGGSVGVSVALVATGDLGSVGRSFDGGTAAIGRVATSGAVRVDRRRVRSRDGSPRPRAPPARLSCVGAKSKRRGLRNRRACSSRRALARGRGRRRTFCIFSSSCSALLSISLVRSRTATTFSSSCHILFACSLSRSAVAEGSSSARAVQSTVLSTTALVRSDFLSRSMCPAASEVTVRPTSRSRLPPAPGLIGSVGSIASVDPPRASRAPRDRARVFFRHLKRGLFSLHIRGSRDTPIPGIFLGGIIRGTNSCSTRSQNSLTPKPSSRTRRSPFCKPSNGLCLRAENASPRRSDLELLTGRFSGRFACPITSATYSCRSRNDRLGNGSPVRTRAEP